ncbi:phage tail protein [Frederiksenia canicola]
MYHLDNNSGVATRPDIPTVLSTQPRWFTEGGNGTSPSYPGAHWFNIVQGELLGVLSAAGITPQKHQLNQVTQAIQNLIRQGVSGKAEASHTHGIAQITGLSDALNGLSQKAGEAKTAADNAQAFANQKATELDNKKTDKLIEQTLDLTRLDPDKWYPVVLKMPDVRKLYRFSVRRTLGDGNNPTWATHGAGFSTYCEWETQPSQWGAYPYIDSMRLIRQFTYAYCHQSPMLKIGQIYQASWEYIYLRGGTSYTLSRESDVIVDIGVSGYTWQHSRYSATLPVIDSYDESLVPKTSRQAIKDSINDEMVGQVAFFASSTPPSGWLKANGAAVSRTTYAVLFARIGTRFGAGDGSTTFNLPDLRGEFVRGWDDGRNIDAGRALGSHQGDAIRNITASVMGMHLGNINGALSRGDRSGVYHDGGTGHKGYLNFDASRVVPTASENRPRNIALLACIKY